MESSSGEESEQTTIREMLETSGPSDGQAQGIYRDRDLLDPKTIVDEDRIVGRDEELSNLINHVRPALRGQSIPNVLVYGPAGTGKSLIVKRVIQELDTMMKNRGLKFVAPHLNCQPINSLGDAIYELIEQVAEEKGDEVEIAKNGVSHAQKYDYLYDLISGDFDIVLFVVDEIDLLVGWSNRDEPLYSQLLYQMSRLGQVDVGAKVSVAAITNNHSFMQKLDGRTDSSYNPEYVVFGDYEPQQLEEILEKRRDAFQPGVLQDDVIPLAAAFAGKDHGDARKAIELVREAGDLVRDSGKDSVTENEVRLAQQERDLDRSVALILKLSPEKQRALLATALAIANTPDELATAPSLLIYDVFKRLAKSIGNEPKTKETMINYLKEAEAYGLVSISKQSKGRKTGPYLDVDLSPESEAVIDSLLDSYPNFDTSSLPQQLGKMANQYV